VSRRTFVLLLLGLTVVIIYATRHILPPFILAVVTAYVLNPVVKLSQRKLNLSRVNSIILVSLVLVGVVAVTIYWVGGGLLTEARQVTEERRFQPETTRR
jgi:predicted PurR-regulated permease PerM